MAPSLAPKGGAVDLLGPVNVRLKDEGELWFEVDRFPESRAAFERATRQRPTPNAWIGLARAADRLGDTVTACRAYTTASSTKNLPTSVELEISLYALKCKF